MSSNLAQARARESAADDWISSREERDGTSYHGSTLDRLLREGFLTGAEWAAGEAEAETAKAQMAGRDFVVSYWPLRDKGLLTINSSRGVPDTIEANGVKFTPSRPVQVAPGEPDPAARERAEEWLTEWKRTVGVPSVPTRTAAQQLMVDAYTAGFTTGAADQDDQWTVERATGQRQLDDAAALIREGAELLRGYEVQHRNKLADPLVAASTALTHATLEKANRNALMAARFEAWLRGEDRYPVSAADQERVVSAMLDAGIDQIGEADEPVSLDLPGVVDQAGAVRRARAELDAAFAPREAPPSGALLTGDPRFDPLCPVTVNGYLYHPAKEA